MGKCCVNGCRNRSNHKINGLSYHRFPRNKQLAKIWADMIGRPGWTPTDFTRICSVHFTQDCFKEKRRLRLTAIPTIFPSRSKRKNGDLGSDDDDFFSDSDSEFEENPPLRKQMLIDKRIGSSPQMKTTSLHQPVREASTSIKKIVALTIGGVKIDISQKPIVLGTSNLLETKPTRPEPLKTETTTTELLEEQQQIVLLENKKNELNLEETEKIEPIFLETLTTDSDLLETVMTEPNLKTETAEADFIETEITVPNLPDVEEAPELDSELETEITLFDQPEMEEMSNPHLENDVTDPHNILATKAKVISIIEEEQKRKKDTWNKIRSLREQTKRLKKKVASMKLIIKDLKKKCKEPVKEKEILEGISKTSLFLYQRQKDKVEGHLEKPYDNKLKAFALTLNFLSPEAYNYVRNTFDTCLPHPKTLARWYKPVITPGFHSIITSDNSSDILSEMNSEIESELTLSEQ